MQTTPSKSKYLDLAEEITREIRSGLVPPGAPLPSIRQLMSDRALSMTTVVRSLRLLESRGVVSRHPQRGFFACATPPGGPLVRTAPVHGGPRSRQIAFVTPALSGDTDLYLRGVGSAVDARGYALSTFSSQADLRRYRDLLDRVVELNCAGAIVHSVPGNVIALDESPLWQSGIPAVLIGTALPGLSCDRAFVSGLDAGAKVARHLLKRGYGQVATLIEDPEGDEFKAEFLSALRVTLDHGGVTLDDRLCFRLHNTHGYSRHPDPFIDAQKFVARQLADGIKFRAIVCSHDYPAIGAKRAIEAAGLRVPEDIAVISGHRCAGLGADEVSVTSFETHREEQAQRAISLLLRRIDGHTGPTEVHFVSGDFIEGVTG